MPSDYEHLLGASTAGEDPVVFTEEMLLEGIAKLEGVQDDVLDLGVFWNYYAHRCYEADKGAYLSPHLWSV